MQSQTLREDPKMAQKAEFVQEVCDYIQEAYTSKVTLASLGARFRISEYRLRRVFVEVMGISPRKYLEECRVNLLKHRLRRGDPVIIALRRTGYSSQSWLYGDSRGRLGMTPASYRNGGEGVSIEYATGDSPVGRILVAATEHGICSVKAGTSDGPLVASLEAEYPNALISRARKTERFLDGVNKHLRGQEARLPLDLKGTDFQLRVWTALRSIPIGETRSYSEVAQMIGEPKAVRAVGNACASNPVPLIIPCHRVIRSDGGLGGYGLGLPRKKALLAMERSLAGNR